MTIAKSATWHPNWLALAAVVAQGGCVNLEPLSNVDPENYAESELAGCCLLSMIGMFLVPVVSH